MKHKTYTVFDSKAECYMLPFFARADGEALRMFAASIQKPGHQFANNPGDYTLFATGEYDDNRGVFENFDVHKNLGNGVQFKEEVSNG